MQLDQLCHFCDDFLAVGDFDDYCPNGLQVEGRAEVMRLISGVTASLDLIEAALDLRADAMLVHHGYFWKGEPAVLSGYKGRRIKRLMQADVSLLAYHLPLDFHTEVGNNAQLAKRMGWQVEGQLGEIWLGETRQTLSAEELREDIGEKIDSNPLLIVAGPKPVRRIGWCTGAAQSYIEKAATAGVDAFVSGEISEQTVHLARELGIHYIAAGHHATERYGVQALGALLAERFAIEHHFIDIDNPV